LTSHRFYIKEKPRESTTLYLEGEEHHHLSKVARIKIGEKVWLFDETGMQYLACVEAIEQKKTRLVILETKQKLEPKVHVTLAQALLKTKRMDLVIRKATELGTHAIVPLTSHRTVIKIEDKQDQKLTRWKRIAVEASKQCGRSVMPEIHPILGLKTFIARGEEDKKIFLSERGGEPLRDMLMHPLIAKTKIPNSVILLVGPEGGWTELEEQDIMDNQYEAVSLGSLTLRSETAAIVSLAMVSHFWKNEDVS
jgi:16S rRNA (uracil1498-N3)-methyltransferase